MSRIAEFFAGDSGRRRAFSCLALRRLAVVFFGALGAGATELPPEQAEFFEAKVRPIFVEHCYRCHSAESGKSKGSLRLDTRDALRAGGGTGAAIVPGQPEKSLLLEAVRYGNADLQMPPPDDGEKLSADQIAVLEEWIRMGAPDTRVDEARPAALHMTRAREHWAFQPVVKPVPPAVKRKAWLTTPVDAFVLAKLEAKGLAPAAPADKRTLLRRVTYDLTGLPPTADEMETFLRDGSADAYPKVVERLLASPRYGERWGRFWLDVARYADTKGYLAGNVERRYAFSHTYRDYVVQAFNDDKPFDRFVIEQLAADQLPLGEDKSALGAMGFLTLGKRFLNNQNDIIDDRIDVVTRGLMGLTVACARCHDHKFDPIPTRDYYALHGVFSSSEEPAEKPLLGPLIETPAYEAFLKKQADIEAKVKERGAEEVKKFIAGVREKTGDYLLGARDAAALRPEEKLDLFAGARKLNLEILKRWQTALADERRRTDPVLAPWFAFAALPDKEFADQARDLIAGWQARGLPIEGYNAALLTAFTKADAPLASLKNVAEVYNRVLAGVEKAWQTALELAAKNKETASIALPGAAEEAIRQWLLAADAPPNLPQEVVAQMLKRQIDDKTSGLKRDIEALNWTEPGAPLRAMALVDKPKPRNSRIFMRGNPASPGPEAPRQFLELLSGDAPVPFAQGSGRLELARAIAAPANPLTARVLVNRVWGWHFGEALVRTPSDFGVRTAVPVQRELLDWLATTFVEQGWSVKHLHRVIVLSSTYRQSSDANARAAELDPDNQLLHRFQRRRLDFEALRDTLLAVSGTLDPKLGGLPDDLTKEPFTTRRTLYGFIDRSNLPAMFRTFDYPSPDTSTAQRFATTVPQQALFMLNSPFVQEQARHLMRRSEILAAKTEREKVQALYRVLYQRAAEREEVALAQRFVSAPVSPVELRPADRAGWKYGRGYFDGATERVTDFAPLTVFQDARLIPGASFPDETFGHLSLTATGGHPGRTEHFASIRRWTAPGKGTVRVVATLGHGSTNGDGVRGRIVSSATGPLGTWTVMNQKVDTKLEDVTVDAGLTLDFVVDGLATPNADTYTWAPIITFTPDPEASDLAKRTWDARKDFAAPEKVAVPLTRWEELAQVLLLSNELAFVD